MTSNVQPLTELLKHLRTIHFLIVLASLLTLLAVFSGSSGEVSLARQQLERVTSIGSSWENWTKRFSLEQTGWLKSIGNKWLDLDSRPVCLETKKLIERQMIPESHSAIWQFELEGFPMYFFLSTNPRDEPSRRLVFAMPHGKLDKRDTLPTDISFPGTGGPPPFATIAQFRDFWDSARQPKAWFASELASKAYFVEGPFVMSPLPLLRNSVQGSETLALKNSSLGGCRDPRYLAAFQDIVPKNSYDGILCRELNGIGLVIPFKSREPRIPVDLQQWLIEEFELAGPTGSFSDSFPELHRVTQDYQELTLDKALNILEAELLRSGEKIEFLGMRLPESLMATWGGIAILLLQIYFWLHLRALPSMEGFSSQMNNEVAWIGIYRDVFARVTTITTILILPVGATICAVWVASLPTWVAIILPLIITYFALCSAHRLWTKP